MSANTKYYQTTGSRWREVLLGLLIIAVAITITRLWIGAKNARRADSLALRQSVALTITAADRYNIPRPSTAWERLLDAPADRTIPTDPAHGFVDSFLISYQDGILDSVETIALCRILQGFQPETESRH